MLLKEKDEKKNSKYDEEKRIHDLENVKLKLKMISKSSKSTKVSVDDYISNILGSGLNISKPTVYNKFESQSDQNINIGDRNNKSNGYEFNISAKHIPTNDKLFPESKIESDFFRSLPQFYQEIIFKVKLPNGDLDTQKIYTIFISSGLSMDILGSIWSVINRTSPGKLTLLELSIGLAMISLYQKHLSTNNLLPLNPLTWDYVTSKCEFPIPSLSVDTKTTPSYGIDLSNIYPSNQDVTEPISSTIENLPENDNWADFSSFVSQDDNSLSKTQMNNVSHVNNEANVANISITEDIIQDQNFDIQKQINNQFSTWENDIKSENTSINVPNLTNDSHSQKSNISSKSSKNSLIIENSSNNINSATKLNTDSDFGDFQIFSNEEPTDFNSTNSLSCSNNIIKDKYQIFSTDLQDPKNNLIDQWLRCLNQCRKIIADVVRVLNRVVDQTIKVEVFNNERGVLLLSGLIEVYRITRNIKLSTSKTNLFATSNSLLEVFTNIEKHWNDFMLLLPDEMQIDVQTRLSKGTQGFDSNNWADENSLTEYCGVCLCALNSYDGFLSHGLRRYHCPCANLWVNTLDLTLPGLYFPGSVL